MPNDLTSMKTRVRVALMDMGAAVWDEAAVTEGLRLALGEYGLAGQAAVTLNGLDGAAVTTLPGLHDQVIVWGAAAYCALSRAVDRAESAQLGSEASELKSWGDQRLKEFKAMLGSIFPGYLVVLAGSGSGGQDPAKLAAEVDHLGAQTALLEAQAALVAAQTSAASGQESRSAAAAQQAADERVSEAARRADLRQASGPAWGNWPDQRGTPYPGAPYPGGYERS